MVPLNTLAEDAAAAKNGLSGLNHRQLSSPPHPSSCVLSPCNAFQRVAEVRPFINRVPHLCLSSIDADSGEIPQMFVERLIHLSHHVRRCDSVDVVQEREQE